jgi:hypothetical protein
MPYIEDEEEKKIREEHQAKRNKKNKQLDATFTCLTQQQQHALRDMWKAYNDWDRQTDEDWLLYNTYVKLKEVRGDFYQAFPCLTQSEEN